MLTSKIPEIPVIFPVANSRADVERPRIHPPARPETKSMLFAKCILNAQKM